MTSGIRLVTSSVIKKTINTDGTITDEAVLPPDNIGLYDETTEGSTSKVYILPTGIEMASRNGIEIKSGAGINIKSGDEKNISVISIDKNKGIWMGSNKTINFFAGEEVDVNGKTTDKTGAAVEIGPTRILMGVSNLTNNGSTTALDITESNIILGAGIIKRIQNVGSAETDINDTYTEGSSSPYEALKDKDS